MQRKSTPESKDFISLFTFEELLNQVEFDLRINEFVVMEIETANHAAELNKPFRSDYFAIFLIQKGNIGFKQLRSGKRRYYLFPNCRNCMY